jgi:hypothetical protein
MYIGNTVRIPVEVKDSAERAAGNTAMMAWRGKSRLTGTVRDRNGSPVANARVVVAGTGLEAHTGARGTFGLDSLPAGTHTLDVRVIGYVPVQTVVHLSERMPAVANVTLGERAVVLSSVQVRGTPIYSSLFKPKLAGFFDRMRDNRLGVTNGYFITPADLERRKPSNITQMVENLPSVHIRHGQRPGDDVIVGRRDCPMTVFLDGVRVIGKVGSVREESLNTIISPGMVAAMEIYADAFDAPPQYQPENATCGVVLVWTK